MGGSDSESEWEVVDVQLYETQHEQLSTELASANEEEREKHALAVLRRLVKEVLAQKRLFDLPLDPTSLIVLSRKQEQEYATMVRQLRLSNSSMEELDKLENAMRYATAAYGCNAHPGKESSTVNSDPNVDADTANCAKHLLVLLQLTGVQVADVLCSKWSTSTFRPGYLVAVDHQRQQVVLSVRGSCHSSRHDWLTDLCAETIPFQSGWAHAGVTASAAWLTNQLAALLATTCKQHGYELVLTGHSLGGAVAAMVTLNLVKAADEAGGVAFPIRCVSFGAPPVVSSELAEAAKPYVTIVVNNHDLVSRLSVLGVEKLLGQLKTSGGLVQHWWSQLTNSWGAGESQECEQTPATDAAINSAAGDAAGETVDRAETGEASDTGPRPPAELLPDDPQHPKSHNTSMAEAPLPSEPPATLLPGPQVTDMPPHASDASSDGAPLGYSPGGQCSGGVVLHLPGRVLHLHTDRTHTSQPVMLLEADATCFQHIMLSQHMKADHQPQQYLNALCNLTTRQHSTVAGSSVDVWHTLVPPPNMDTADSEGSHLGGGYSPLRPGSSMADSEEVVLDDHLDDNPLMEEDESQHHHLSHIHVDQDVEDTTSTCRGQGEVASAEPIAVK